MRLIRPFPARRLAVIHLAAWSSFVALFALDGYYDLPHVGPILVSALVFLVLAPLVVATCFFVPASGVASPRPIQNFVRLSPWFLSMLWA
jgi:hypothetical protein